MTQVFEHGCGTVTQRDENWLDDILRDASTRSTLDAQIRGLTTAEAEIALEYVNRLIASRQQPKYSVISMEIIEAANTLRDRMIESLNRDIKKALQET